MTSGSRYLGLAMSFIVVSACARPTTAPAPRPIVPTDGPHASIYTSVSGGLLNRRVDAVFRIDESAYVLVGHVSADGSLEIIYPATPYEAKRLRGEQRIRTRMFDAQTDVNFALYHNAYSRYRTMSSKFDSYDGSGQGYVFIVASDMPLNYGAFSVGREWDQIAIDDFNTTSDPRIGIREFADELAAGAKYTIAYARGWTTVAYNSYVSASDCAFLSSALADQNPFGVLWYGITSPFYWNAGPFLFGGPFFGGLAARTYSSSCGTFRYASFASQRPYTLSYTPQLNPSNPRPPVPDPKTTRAWAPRTKYNPRAASAAFRNRQEFPDPFGSARTAHAATWSNAGGSSGSNGSLSNTANNTGSNASSAPAPAKDASGNTGPKTKQ